MGNSNSGRPRLRPHLGMFLGFGVADVANLRDGDWRVLRWSNDASIGVQGTGFGIELRYSRDDAQQCVPVVVDRLPCYFGGTRPMLRCPRCDRRCRKLYLYGNRFMCRVCTRARYWTQSASTDARLTKRIRRLQTRLAPDEDADDSLSIGCRIGQRGCVAALMTAWLNDYLRSGTSAMRTWNRLCCEC